MVNSINTADCIKNLPNFDSLQYLIQVINAHGKAMLVGGCVRDMIIGYPVKDIDIAVDIIPSKVQEILNKNGIKCIPTGIKFGTVTALISGACFEITTLRKDLKCDGRHAEVSFGTNWKDDAERRDFTFNALYEDLEGNVLDYFDGISDLKRKLVRFIGNPEKRIKEDYLRILRYFRFLSYIGVHEIDDASISATEKLSKNLELISGERIHSEILKMMGNKFAKDALHLIYKNGVHKALHMPELKMELLKRLNMIEGEAIVNLAAVLKISSINEEGLMHMSKKWKLPNAFYRLLFNLIFNDMLNNMPTQLTQFSIEEHKQNCYRIGEELYNKHLLLSSIVNSYRKENLQTINKIIAQLKKWTKPKIPVSGNDLLNLGFQGKEIGIVLSKIKERWISSNFTLTKKGLLEEYCKELP